MSAEMISAAAARRVGAPRRADRALRPGAGLLADGTPFYAPAGAVLVDGSLVTCHLCGRSLRSVAAHLASHGWTKQQYCEAFGLERGQSLKGPATRKLRAAAQASRDRADRQLAAVAADAARRHGFADIGAFVVARSEAGASMTAISREAGLHKDWLARHLSRIDPAAADLARRRAADRPDMRWLPALRRLGYHDVASYLRDRHLEQHQTVNAMAAELGLSHHAVTSALRRHGVDSVAHIAKRQQARQRASGVAASLGYPDIAGYVTARRSAGWTWQSLAAESGQPETWLRRHAGPEAAARGQQARAVSRE